MLSNLRKKSYWILGIMDHGISMSNGTKLLDLGAWSSACVTRLSRLADPQC